MKLGIIDYSWKDNATQMVISRFSICSEYISSMLELIFHINKLSFRNNTFIWGDQIGGIYQHNGLWDNLGPSLFSKLKYLAKGDLANYFLGDLCNVGSYLVAKREFIQHDFY